MQRFGVKERFEFVAKLSSFIQLGVRHLIIFSIALIIKELCLITIYNTVILVCSVIKILDKIFSLSRRREPSRFRENLTLYSTSCQNNSAKGNFRKLFLDQISFETKHMSKVDFNCIFISNKKVFWKYSNFFGEIREPIKTVNHTCYNVQLILHYNTMITF